MKPKRELSSKEKVVKFYLENSTELESVCTRYDFNIADFSKDELDFMTSFKKQLKSPTRNQHYVPQFHLKQFENNE
jgi:hypothetical protein